MAKDPTFPFYAQDYLVDTIRWSRDMKSLHVDLLAETWVNGPLKDAGGHPKGLRGDDLLIWEEIKHKWELVEEPNPFENQNPEETQPLLKHKATGKPGGSFGFWVNEKIETVRADREKFRRKQSETGKKGGRPKKATTADKKGMGFGTNNPEETQPFLNLKPTENPEETLLEDESENEIEDEEREEGGKGEETLKPPVYLIPAMLVEWKKHKPGYPEDRGKDYPALQAIAEFICTQGKTPYDPQDGDTFEVVLPKWAELAAFIAKHNFFKNHSLEQVNRYSQSILQSLNDAKTGIDSKPQGGGKQSHAERLTTARDALAGRLGAKVNTLRPNGESGIPG